MSFQAAPDPPTVFRPVPIDPTGRHGPTRGEAAGPFWRSSSRGLHVPAWVPADDPDQRVYEASFLLPDYGGVTGWAALRWARATYFDGVTPDGRLRPVPLAVMHSDIRPRPGILVTSERLAPRDLTTFDDVAVTTHVRSVGYEMRYAETLWRAVVAFDMAARDDLVSLGQMWVYVATLNGWIGVPQLRAALALAEENSWSPMETIMRLYWVLVCGFPSPLCNRPIFDLEGQHVGTPDILDVEAGVVGEFEGEVHLERRRRGKDLEKETAYRRLGLEFFAMVGADRRSPDNSIVPRMIETRQRASFEAESQRRWTIEPPPWWTPTTTVAARRALSERQRSRLLRYRIG